MKCTSNDNGQEMDSEIDLYHRIQSLFRCGVVMTIISFIQRVSLLINR